MSESIKWLTIISASAFGFIMAVTSPTVHIYFMQHVNQQVYAVSSTLEIALAAAMTSAMSKEGVRIKLRKIYGRILLADSVGYAIISLWGIDDANVRFLGLAVLSAITINIWTTLMLDAINSVISGNNLTDYQTLSKAWQLWSTLIGSGIAIFATGTMGLETAILMQCVGNAIFSICEYKSFRMIAANRNRASERRAMVSE